MWSIATYPALVNGEDLRVYTTCTYRGLIQDLVSPSAYKMRASSDLWLVILPNLATIEAPSPKDSDGGAAILLPCSSYRHAISTSDVHTFAARWTAKNMHDPLFEIPWHCHLRWFLSFWSDMGATQCDCFPFPFYMQCFYVDKWEDAVHAVRNSNARNLYTQKL
jgi:hypothetical protein